MTPTLELSPIPPIVFRVGITGHRPNRLDPRLSPLLKEKATEVLTRVKEAVWSAPALRPGGPLPVLRLVTSLAEGADRIAAHAALNLGFRIQVPLPFCLEEYQKDFGQPGSIKEFQGLLAAADSVFQLNASPLARNAGYRAAGEVVLTQCDLLLAIWDGKSARGFGGTAEMVELAQLIGLSVLHIDSQNPGHFQLLDGEGSHSDALAALDHSIRSMFNVMERPSKPDSIGIGGSGAERGRGSGMIRRIVTRGPNANTPAGIAEDYMQAKWPRRTDPTAYMLLRFAAEGKPGLPARQDPTREVTEIENASLRPYFLWTDALAVRYSEFSRSASLRIQLWAALAVISCLLTIPLEYNLSLLRLLTCFELISTLAVLIEAFIAWRFRWHSRWMLFRSIAEQIRCLDLLAPMALGIPRLHGYSAQDGAAEERFASFFAQSLVRSIGLPSAEVNDVYLNKQTHQLLAAIDRQRKFHDLRSHRYERIERLLTRGGICVFLLAFLVCAHEFLHTLNLAQEHSHWITICTVLLPSLGATIAAIAAQGEFKRLANRSDGMRRVLYLLERRLRLTPPTSLHAARVATTDVSEILITEVRDWRILLSARAPSVKL